MTNCFRLACILGLTATVLSAGIIYSTDGTATPGFFPENGATSTSSVYHAYQFTVPAGQGGVFDQLTAAVLSSTAFTGVFYLRSDTAGSLGSILDTVSISFLGDSTGHLYTGTSTNHVTLIAGNTYWIEAASPTGSNSYYWLQANPILTAREYSSATGYFNDQPMLAFALLESEPAEVPEPGTWVMALSGLAAFAWRRGKRRAATRG